ncbi:MAG: cobalamin biosynthesis protein CobD [Tissierellia bacterium]|nr:adenosylcobinamide-phosphate synthase CbiB [Bacillota bacterium]NLL22177.1 cobalamin biosynthesis protein CobD [Tissierellia bacterium]
MLSVAIVLDMLIPDPLTPLHPIALVGRWIEFLQKHIRRILGNTYSGGVVLLLMTLAGAGGITSALLWGFSKLPWGHFIFSTTLYYFLLCGATLRKSGFRVMESLERDSLSESRQRLGEIVGRDTSALSEEEIIKGTIETLAENTVDGLTAPLFYILAASPFGFGLQAGVLYKCINTLDSMVGYKDERYRKIGCASAKIDDLANYIPARIGAILMLISGAVSGLDISRGWRVLLRDARKHVSPNSGFPEAAAAGLLGITLGGDAHYFGKKVQKATLGDETRPVDKDDILRMNKIILVVEAIFLLISFFAGGQA